MSITNRQPRPLKRDLGNFRDDRLLIVACDDTYAPKQYFDFFQIPRVQIHVVPSDAKKSAPYHVLSRLREYEHEEDDELWMLLDTDHYIQGEHLGQFTQTLQEAKKSNIKVALSRPCFELWLLLHHTDSIDLTSMDQANKVEIELRKTLGEYNKTNLKKEHYPIERVAEAIKKAASLDSGVTGNDIPSSITTRVYLLWKAIITSASPKQLPPCLVDIFLS